MCDREIDALLRGDIDVAITSRPDKDRRLGRRELFSLVTIALVAPDHPLGPSSLIPTAPAKSLRLGQGRNASRSATWFARFTARLVRWTPYSGT